MVDTKKTNKLVLIDGNSLINRAFYATPPMSTANGTPTNAVYAFMNMLVKIIEDIAPSYILIAFDRKEPTFRHKMYVDYKGTRKPMPDDLRPQIDLLKKVLDTMNIARYEQAGIEADDIIGSVAKKFSVQTVIITGDKDSFQLVDDSTSVYFTRKGISDLEIYNSDNFQEKMGINPIQIIDLKSMMGDSSDNIPGIRGVGEKTAIDLVQTYGSLENLYNNLDELKGKLKEKVEESKELAFLSKTLATIDTGVDIPLTLDKLSFDFPFNESVKRIFVDLEFRNLLKRTDIFSNEKNELTTDDIDVKMALPDIVRISSSEQFYKVIKNDIISVIVDKNINFYDGHNEFEFVIKENFFDEGIAYDEAICLLKPTFENADLKLVVYCKKDIRHELDKYAVCFNAYADDLTIERYLVDFNGKADNLDEIIYSNGLDEKRKAFSLYELHKKYSLEITNSNITHLYADIELPLSDVLYEMEIAGFKIDISALNEMSADFTARIKDLYDKIIFLAGESFNVNSPKQLSVILFDKLGLKAGKKNKNGYSTNAEMLEAIEGEHEIVPLILKYRQLQKLYSTYIEGFRPLIDRPTGLVHTCFNQTLTTTGRLSSKEPNLQNIPVREQEGKEIRKLFISSFDNGMIVGADYSQIELRLLAHFSGCTPLVNAYNTGLDIHTLTASQVFSTPIESVSGEMRRSAKAVNFGIIYGISDFGLSRQLKISPKRAGEYIKKYFEMYPSVKEYMDSNVAFVKENGYVSTLLGRKRYIREINSANFNLRSFGERAAMNMPLQGTAADIIKIAMIRVRNAIKNKNLKSKLILQVHDELLVDTAPGEEEIVKKILVEEMESAVKLNIPLTVETEAGKRWFDAK